MASAATASTVAVDVAAAYGGGQRGDGQYRGGQRNDGQRARSSKRRKQAQPQWQPQPGVSARSQVFGGGNNCARSPPAASAPQPNPPSGWNGFQGRNPNDPFNTD
jgi:hypothetical protein